MANSCETCKHYEVESYNEPCVSCRFRDYDVPTKWENPFKKKTNADRIRSMTDEEIAQWLCLHYGCTKCPGEELCTLNDGEHNGLIKWLKQPVEE